MALFFRGRQGGAKADPAVQAAADARIAAWDKALSSHTLPDFVRERLVEASQRKTPWLATMTPAELLLATSHGLRPVATVTGTCWFQFGRSWTEGHSAGWRTALERLKAEAVACGASAVVDVKMRTVPSDLDFSMDYTLIGTAVRVERLPPSTNPVIATTPALEFVRLLEADVVPTGIAVGAHYEWFTDSNRTTWTNMFTGNQPLTTLGAFWERARRRAHQELREDAARHGNGVLARTQFGQLFKQEQGENAPVRYLGRHIVIGTVVDRRPGQRVPHDIESVVDMRDELSPLQTGAARRNDYSSNEREGPI